MADKTDDKTDKAKLVDIIPGQFRYLLSPFIRAELGIPEPPHTPTKDNEGNTPFARHPYEDFWQWARGYSKTPLADIKQHTTPDGKTCTVITVKHETPEK